MSRLQKLVAAATVGTAWYFADDGLLLILALVCFGRTLADQSTDKGSWKATITYCILIIMLTGVASVGLRSLGTIVKNSIRQPGPRRPL